MIDFVFVVDKPKHWHRMNLQRNPDHYSALRHLGAERIVKIQETGAGVYYNTLVRCEDKVRRQSGRNVGSTLIIISNNDSGFYTAHICHSVMIKALQHSVFFLFVSFHFILLISFYFILQIGCDSQ